ncbi:MAG: MraY family glycosyltransferase [Eubacteriales bacterium]
MKDIMIYIVSCGAALVATPIVSRLSIMIGAVDKPNNRKVHDKNMPNLGGLSIFAAFLLGHAIFYYPHRQFSAIFLGSIIIIITGILDDIYELSPKIKILAQLIAAGIVIFYGHLYLTAVNIPFVDKIVDLSYFGYFLTFLWIIGITNAINLIDGLDGLASGVSTITFITMYVLATLKQDYFVMTYALILAGASTGFLVYNFHPAKIFMGDTGAMFLGYMLSVLSLMGFKNATFISFVVPILILGVPVFDTFFAIIRRKLRGQSFAQADKEHLHHLLMTTNSSQTKTVLTIYGVSILFSIVSIIYSIVSAEIGLIILIILFVSLEYTAKKIGLLDKHFFLLSSFVNGEKEQDQKTITKDKN